ncbi:MAG: efflux RND transporter periplasmic adaptor subunit [Povalibacter sp.]
MRFSRWAMAPVCLLLVAACGGKQQQAAPPPPEVTVMTLQKQTVTDVRTLPGRTSAYLIAEVRPQVTGIIESRLFEEGSLVKAGQPLYQLDDRIYRAEQASRQAEVQRAKATLDAARLTEKRTAELARIDAVSASELEAATAAFKQGEADLASAEAALQSANVSLAYARITSPIAGRVGKSAFTKGALVTANQEQPLTTVQQLDPIYVDLTQSSSELLRLRQEFGGTKLSEVAPVAIVLEDGSRYAHPGELKFADVTVDPQTGSFALRAVVPNPDRLLLPGMYVRATLERGQRANAVLAPQRAITRDPKGNGLAMVVDANNKVEQRNVKTVRTVGDNWLIDQGLDAGDRVIIEGLQKVQPGMTVKPVEAPSAQANAAAPGPASAK